MMGHRRRRCAIIKSASLQRPTLHIKLIQCWANVADGEPTLNRASTSSVTEK